MTDKERDEVAALTAALENREEAIERQAEEIKRLDGFVRDATTAYWNSRRAQEGLELQLEAIKKDRDFWQRLADEKAAND